jgi:Spy/CpxP family protein refolding chaperone
MKSFSFRFLIAALAVLLGSYVANAQTADATTPPPPHAHQFGMRGEHMGFFPHQLNLTDDQKSQMKTIMHTAHPAMKTLFQQQHQIEVQLRQYVEGNYNDAKVRALATQKAQIEVELTVAQTKLHNQMYQLLTSDQQSQVKELEAKHEAQMQERMAERANQAPSEE